MSYAIDQTMRAAEDSESTIDTLREELAAAERERDELRERDAFLMRERIAVATALDVPYATELGEAVAARLARLTPDLVASREAWATLAAAVQEEREARNVMNEADQDYEDGVAGIEPYNAALAAWLPTDDAVAALLSAAPAPSTVSAALVRAYLAADDAYDDAVETKSATCEQYQRARKTRAALDAALARCP